MRAVVWTIAMILVLACCKADAAKIKRKPKFIGPPEPPTWEVIEGKVGFAGCPPRTKMTASYAPRYSGPWRTFCYMGKRR